MQSTSKATIYGGLFRQFVIRLVTKMRMVRLYSQVRNKLIARNGSLILGGVMVAHGFIGIGIFLIFVGTVIDEL